MRATNRILRWGFGVAALAAVAAVIIAVSSSTGPTEHRVSVVVPNATDVLGGQYVKAAGVNVGTVHAVTPVDRGHAVRLTFELDNSVWPLPTGTTLTVRWGGTASYVNRYINLVRGTGAGTIARDGVLPARAFHVPVEFDSFLDTFTPSVRQNLKQFLGHAGIALAGAKPGLIRSIERAPAALTQVDAVLDDLDANGAALTDLIGDGEQVVSSVNASNPSVESLLTSAATTFTALDTRTREIDSTLAATPGMLHQFRTTLRTATPTLLQAKRVVAKLSPGIDQIDADARPLDGVLVTLKHVTPDAISALASVRKATPSLNPLLDDLTSLSPTLGSIGRQANTALNCIRPYTPDIVAFTSDWGDFLASTDGKNHVFRADPQVNLYAPSNAQTDDSAQLARTQSGLSFAFPVPPGEAAGQPWFIPACGEGPNTLNANDDPENNASAAELPAAPTTTTATASAR